MVALGGHGIVTGAAALKIWDVALPNRLEQDAVIDVAAKRSLSHKHRGIRQHELIDPPAWRPHPTIAALKVARPEAAWAQLASMGASVLELVQVGDGLLRRKNPLCKLDDLRRVVAGQRCRRGVGRLRAALKLVRRRTDSIMETWLRLQLIQRGYREPDINPVLLRDRGYEEHFDLVYHEARIVIEYDGSDHDDPKVWSSDADRTRRLEAAGWRVIRVTKAVLTAAGAREFFEVLDTAFAAAASSAA